MTNEAAIGFTMLYGVLAGDATLLTYVAGIFRDVAPTGITGNYVIVGHQSGTDVLGAFATRLMTTHLYRVLVIGPESDYANLVTAANRIDAVLQPSGQPLRLTGGTLACYRETTLALAQTVAGVAYLSLGGLYRVQI